MSPKIAILLSTYNGAEFLSEQLDSILDQTYSDVVVVVRDDGSSDGTPSLLADYASRFPGKFCLVPADGDNRGASGSFSFLIEYVLANKQQLGLESAYMMFADQDDIWYPEKIENELRVLLDAERSATDAEPVPVLVHSDLQVVSENMEIIAESLVRYQGLEIERNRFTNILISNLVTGCTALINESLARKAVPVSDRAIMHDWWLALVASAFGKLVFLDTPLVRYRQHGNNTIGAKEYDRAAVVSKTFLRKLTGHKANEHLLEVADQARAFRSRFGRQLGFRQKLGLRLSETMGVRMGVLQRLFYRLARLA